MTTRNPEPVSRTYDVVVIGGGIAGTVAAVASARSGARTVLLQDRPVLGGNSSSEVRVSPVGADFNNRHARESGILEELRLELAFRDRWRAPHGTGRPVPLWDAILWEWAEREPNLDLMLNTRVRDVDVAERKIRSVTADQMSSEKRFVIDAPVFLDCTGDGSIAFNAGARFMMGRESRYDYGESRGLEQADDKVLCATLTFSAHDAGHPVPFIAPSWARSYPTDDHLKHRFHARKDYGYWWIEYGGHLDPIADAEEIRAELHRIVYGVWDHIKNHCDGSADHYVLDFVGAVLGKRESRRFYGAHVLTQNDLEQQVLFDDRVAFGGWPLDHNHPPEGMYSQDPPGEMPQRHHLMEKTKREYPKGVVVTSLFTNPPAHWPEYLAPLPGLYSIPLRALHSADVDNLFLAGRHVSATHVAFGSLRVQGTTGVMGEAAGTAAAYCALRGTLPGRLETKDVTSIQQTLLRNDAFIPHCASRDPADLAPSADVSASSEALLVGAGRDEVEDLRGGGARGYTIEEGQHASADTNVKWPLDVPRGQMVYLTSRRLEKIELLLRATDGKPHAVPLVLHRARQLGMFREDPIVSTVAEVSPGDEPAWVEVPLELDIEPGLYWVEAKASEGVSWLQASDAPLGTYRGTWFEEYSRWDRLFDAHAFRITPPSRAYAPENVTNGIARPEIGANIWISDPEQALPQWLELKWPSPTEIGHVSIAFDTYLDAMLQLGVVEPGPARECVRDYAILVDVDGTWREVVTVTGNYQRRRNHDFAPVTARALRLEVRATNGSPSARVYELRAAATRTAFVDGSTEGAEVT